MVTQLHNPIELIAAGPMIGEAHDGASRTTQIVHAANELLKEAGLDGLTIRAVLARTGLARRAFYESFAGKDDLVLAVFAASLNEAARRYVEATDSIADPMERLRVMLRSLVTRSDLRPTADAGSSDRRSAALSQEHLRLAESRPAELQAALAPLVGLIARQLEAGMIAGIVRHADPQRLAMLVYNLIAATTHTELLTHAASAADPRRRQQLADDTWDFCRRAVTT